MSVPPEKKFRLLVDDHGKLWIIIDKDHTREAVEKMLREQYGYGDEDLTYCSGDIGAPITYLDRHCPEQFDLRDDLRPWIDGKEKYRRLLIRRLPSSLDTEEIDIDEARRLVNQRH